MSDSNPNNIDNINQINQEIIYEAQAYDEQVDANNRCLEDFQVEEEQRANPIPNEEPTLPSTNENVRENPISQGYEVTDADLEIKKNFQMMTFKLEELIQDGNQEWTPFLNEKLQPLLFHNLSTNHSKYNAASLFYLKEFFIFQEFYIYCRIQKLHVLQKNELNLILSLMDSTFPFYYALISYEEITITFLEENLKHLFPQLSSLSSDQLIKSEEFQRAPGNTNPFYRYHLLFLKEINALGILSNFLMKGESDLEITIRTLLCLNRLINLFDFVEPTLINEVMAFTIKVGLKTYIDVRSDKAPQSSATQAQMLLIIKNSINQFVNLINLTSWNFMIHCQNSDLKAIIYEERPYNECKAAVKLLAESNKDIALYSDLIELPSKLTFHQLDSTSLEKRNIAITILNEQIGFISNYEKMKVDPKNLNKALIESSRSMKGLIQLIKAYLSTWLVEIKIFDLVFGEKIHEAIILKSGFLLNYLYQNGFLGLDQIVQIWKMTQEKHESISGSILSLLSQIVSFISLEHALFILKEISELHLKEFNNATLRIIEAFSDNHYLSSQKPDERKGDDALLSNLISMQNSDDPNQNAFPGPKSMIEEEEVVFNDNQIANFKSFYIKLLWKLINERNISKGAQPQILKRSRKIFVTVLLKPSFKQELHKYLKRLICTPNVSEFLNTNLAVLSLLLKDLRNLPQNARIELLGEDHSQVGDLIFSLERNYNLIPYLLHTVIFLKNEVVALTQEIIESLSTDKDFNDVMNCLDENYNFKPKPKQDEDRIHSIDEESKEIEGKLNFNMKKNDLNKVRSERQYLETETNKRGLDETLSTEKSIKNSISTISTELSNNEKSKLLILKDFYSTYSAQISRDQILNNYDFVFKNLKLSNNGHNYYTILEQVFDFISFLLFNSQKITMKQNYLVFLNRLMIENSVSDYETTIFFNFFASLIKHQSLTGIKILDSESMEFLLFGVILAQDHRKLSYEAFNVFKSLFYLLNSMHYSISINPANGKMTKIVDLDKLLGFESIWKFYLCSENWNVQSETQAILINIITILSINLQQRESFENIINKIFYELQTSSIILSDFRATYPTLLDSLIQINTNSNSPNVVKIDEESQDPINFNGGINQKLREHLEKVIRLLNLLILLNSNKRNFERQCESELVNVGVQNYFSSNEGKKIYIPLNMDTTFKELRFSIASKLLSTQNSFATTELLETNLFLTYKNTVLSNEKQTLRDIKYDSNSFVLVYPGSHKKVVEPNPTELIDMIEQTCGMLGLESNLVHKALIRNSYKLEETIIWLTDDSNIIALNREIEEESLNTNIINGANNESQKQDTFTLFTDERVTLLKSLLKLNILILDYPTWNLLLAITYPSDSLKELIEPSSQKLQSIFLTCSYVDLLFNMKIIHSVIFNDKSFYNIRRIEDSKKLEWKVNFLAENGIIELFNIIRKLIEYISKSNQIPMLGNNHYHLELSENIKIHEILQISVKWIHFFTLSSAISLSPVKEFLGSAIKIILQNRPQGIHIGISNSPNNSKDSTPSMRTPNFGSPHTSFDGDTKSKKERTNVFAVNTGQVGQEEYDTFEEELCERFFYQMLEQNFYQSILSFFQLLSADHVLATSNDNEKVFYLLLEIHSILNEVDPDCFKTFTVKEVEGNLLLNFLFNSATSKQIRKMIETVFIIMAESKINEHHCPNSAVYISPLLENKKLTSSKEILLLHVSNNYKRIQFEQASEEFFNVYGYILQRVGEIRKDIQDLISLSTLCYSILNNLVITTLSKRTLSGFEQEQLSGFMYIIESSCAHFEHFFLANLTQFEKERQINLIDFLYNNLFHLDEDSGSTMTFNFKQVKFKYNNNNLRHRAYNFLLLLARLREDFKKNLVSKMCSHHKSLHRRTVNDLDLEINLRKFEDKFVGLRNYGATCYFNSLIQQMFMIKEIRERVYDVIFSLNSFGTSYMITDSQKEDELLSKNPVYQLQVLFANLENTIKQHHSPLHLISSFSKAFNNMPIDVRVQQDCEEFFNILVDNIEESSGNKHIFEDVFKVKVANEIISLDTNCPYYSETITPSNSIGLDIKNRRTLEEAFTYYVKEEILEGENKFHLEKYDKKVPIIRRASIKSLPKIAVVHLKRFDFDYISFERTKLNDYLEFPSVFDFGPYLRDTILSKTKDENYMKNIEVNIDVPLTEEWKYELCGIVVHSGSSAEAGHYYSFIKDEEDWYEFDDSKVTKVTYDKVKKDSFGEDKDLKAGEDQSSNKNFFSRCTNAYMLFYRKLENQNPPNKMELDPMTSKPESTWLKRLFERVHTNNKIFLKYKTFIDQDYYKFLQELIEFCVLKNKSNEKISSKEKSMSKRNRIDEQVAKKCLKLFDQDKIAYDSYINHDKVKKMVDDVRKGIVLEPKKKEKDGGDRVTKSKMIQLALYYYFEFITEQTEKAKISQYMIFLKDLLETDKERCCWLLKRMIENVDLFIDLCLVNSNVDVRDSFYKILTFCIFSCIKDEEKYMSSTFNVLQEKIVTVYSDVAPFKEGNCYVFELKSYSTSCVIRFFSQICLGLFDQTRLHWTKYNQFMHLVLDCINYRVPSIIHTCIQECFFNRLVYFIMNNSSGFETQYPKMGGISEPNLSLTISILAELLTSFVTKGVYDLKQYSIYSKFQGGVNIIDMPIEYYNIVNKPVISYILKRWYNESTKKIVHHLSWGLEDKSIAICLILVESIKENFKDSSAIINLINNYHGLVEIDDNFKNKRYSYLFGLKGEENSMLSYLINHKDDSTSYSVLLCLRYWGDLITKNSSVHNYFLQNNFRLIWIYYFLKQISSDQDKKDNLQIEATTDNLNLAEILNFVRDKYINHLNIKSLLDYEHLDENRMIVGDYGERDLEKYGYDF